MSLQNIQVLRCIAAAMVLVQHVVYFSGQIGGDQMLPFRRINLGGMGVYIFFLISGFVIALQTDKPAREFLAHRLLRIYPAYFLALLGSYVIFFVFSTYRPIPDRELLSMLLVPTGALNSSFQIPYWTLIYEMFFYALIFMLMAVARGKAIIVEFAVLSWLVLIVAGVLLGVRMDPPRPSLNEIPFSLLNVYFIMGFFLSRVIVARRSAVAFSAFLFIAVAASQLGDLRYVVTISVLAVSALLALLHAPQLPAFLVRLGDYSYGIYLMHLPIVYCLFLAFKAQGVGFVPSIIVMIAVALPVAAFFGKCEYSLYRNILRPKVDAFFAAEAKRDGGGLDSARPAESAT